MNTEYHWPIKKKPERICHIAIGASPPWSYGSKNGITLCGQVSTGHPHWSWMYGFNGDKTSYFDHYCIDCIQTLATVVKR